MTDWLARVPLLAEGGPMMGLLYLVSLVGVALVLERTVALRREKVAPPGWLQQVRVLVGERGITGLGDDAVWPDVAVADVLRRFVRHPVDQPGDALHQIDWLTSQVEQHLSRGLGTIALLATLAPILGLLGTVTGMIETFSQIAAGGIGDPRALAAGIYEALYTTAGGMSLAIPLLIAHRSLRARVGRYADDMADFLEDLWWLAQRHSDRRAPDNQRDA